jgi:hypothetical protein
MIPAPQRTNEGKEILDIGFKAFVRFHVYTQPYSVNTIVPVERWVNACSIKNAGTNVLVCMGDPLQPGETKSIGGNAFEIWEERHMDLVFTNPNAVVNPVSLAIVTQKFYVDISRAADV